MAVPLYSVCKSCIKFSRRSIKFRPPRQYPSEDYWITRTKPPNYNSIVPNPKEYNPNNIDLKILKSVSNVQLKEK